MPRSQRETASNADHVQDEDPIVETSASSRVDGDIYFIPSPFYEGDDNHPTAAKLFKRLPFLRRVPVMGQILDAFGPSVVAGLFISNFASKGMVYQMINISKQPMMVNHFQGTTIQYQRLSPLSRIGGSLKALTATLTDTFPLFHYTKRWYLLIFAVITGIFCIIYAALPPNPSSLEAAGAMTFLAAFASFTVDILIQGGYSRLIKRNPVRGTAIVSWVYWAIPAGAIVSAVVEGPASDAHLPQIGLYVAGGIVLLSAGVYLFNMLEENVNDLDRHNDAVRIYHERLLEKEQKKAAASQVVKPDEAAEAVAMEDEITSAAVVPIADDTELVLNLQDEEEDTADETDRFVEPKIAHCPCGVFDANWEVVQRNWKIVIYAIIISLCVIVMVCVTILGDTWALLYAMIAIAVVSNAGAFLTLPLALAKGASFMFFNNLLYLSLPGAVDAFYLAKENCLPDGPHFNYTFYNLIGTVVGNVGTIIGGILFTYIFAKQKYVFVTNTTDIIKIIASAFDLLVVLRWTTAVGIPDHVVYIFGASAVMDLCASLASMPTLVLMARLCPRGSESMVYALMASMGNIGGTFSGTIGSVIMETRLPVYAKFPQCDFTNVKWLILIGHMAVPLLNIPLAFLLLPNARICDEIDMKGHTIKRSTVKKVERKAAPNPEQEPIHEDADENVMYLSSNDSDDEGKRHPKTAA